MTLPTRLTDYHLSTIQTAMAFAGIGVLIAFVWNETTVRIFLLGPFIIKYGFSTKLLLTLMQVFGAICTLLSAVISVYLGMKILQRFSISRKEEVAIIAAFLWGIVLYSYEIPLLEGNFSNPHADTLLLELTIVRIGVDLLSCVLYWYMLRRAFLKAI